MHHKDAILLEGVFFYILKKIYKESPLSQGHTDARLSELIARDKTDESHFLSSPR